MSQCSAYTIMHAKELHKALASNFTECINKKTDTAEKINITDQMAFFNSSLGQKNSASQTQCVITKVDFAKSTKKHMTVALPENIHITAFENFKQKLKKLEVLPIPWNT